MLTSLFPQIDWSRVEYVGFDLDGTLYDEFDFICQAYRPVARCIGVAIRQPESPIYDSLLKRWLEKGSSYPYIFSEALADDALGEPRIAEIVRDCVTCFRSCSPSLELTNRTHVLLDILCKTFETFIVSDGNCRLQHRKIDALGLNQWFAPSRIVVSGCRPDKEHKPSPLMVDELPEALKRSDRAGSVVFFGDRDVDHEFARGLGFEFIRVSNMHPV